MCVCVCVCVCVCGNVVIGESAGVLQRSGLVSDYRIVLSVECFVGLIVVITYALWVLLEN